MVFGDAKRTQVGIFGDRDDRLKFLMDDTIIESNYSEVLSKSPVSVDGSLYIDEKDERWLLMRREIEKLKGIIRSQSMNLSEFKFKHAQLQHRNSKLLTETEQNRHELEETRLRASTLLDNSKDLNRSYENVLKQLENTKLESENRERLLRKENTTLVKEMNLLKMKLKIEQETFTAKSRKANDVIDLLKEELTITKQNTKRVESMLNDIKSRDLCLAPISPNPLIKPQGDEQSELNCLYKQLKDQLVYINVLENKLEAASELNTRLVKNAQNYEVMQNNYQCLKKEIDLVVKLKDRVTELEAELDKVHSYSDLDSRILSMYSPKDDGAVMSIASIIELLEKERFERVLLLQEKGSLSVHINVKELEVEYIRSELNQMTNRCIEFESAFKVHQKVLTEMKKLRDLTVRELKILSEQMNASKLPQPLDCIIQDEHTNRSFIRLLETVHDFESKLVACVEDLESMTVLPCSCSSTHSEKQKEFEYNVKKEIEKYTQETQKCLLSLMQQKKEAEDRSVLLSSQIAHLKRELKKKEYDPLKIKIVQLSNNPELLNEVTKIETLEKLKNEVKFLTRLIFKIHKGVPDSLDTHCIVCMPTNSST